MSTAPRLLDQAARFGASNYTALPIVLERGEGVWVWDVDGKRYLDMLSAYSALNQGHRHPRILEAARRQMDRLTLTSRAFHNDQMGPFLEELCTLMGYDQALLMNTGAEAVETAVKMVRKWGYQKKGVAENQARIIVCENNFHGRTTTVVSFSSEPQYRQGFGPYTPGFDLVPYGDLDALEAAIDERTVGFLVEPVQGEGGVVVPPDGYLAGAYELCKKHHVAFMADEIQSGLGRTGRLLCCQWEDVRPDIVMLGKALAGGFYPVSAAVADVEYMDVFTPGDHGSTFGGNPLGAAIGRASLRVLQEEELPRRAAELGQWFMERLRELESPHVEEVRGKGFLIGVVVKKESGPAKPFCVELAKRGILAKETHGQVIRFAPPLIVEKEVLEEALVTIGEVLDAG